MTEQTIVEPLPASQLDHDELYDRYQRLLLAVGKTLLDADEHPGDFYRPIERLREAHRAGTAFLMPDETAAPAGAVVRYAYAVREGDQVFVPELGGWMTVAGTYPVGDKRGVTFTDGTEVGYLPRCVLSVVPATPQEPV